MGDISERLALCFLAVFPKLSRQQVFSADVDSVSAWDSTAAVMLANVVEQELGIRIDFEDLPELTSFNMMLEYVNRALAAKR
jgi:acyl carrier protein